MPFPLNVREEALVSRGRHCCLCRRFVGTKIECHHIEPEAEGGNDSIANCIPLCFDCHAEVQHYNPAHPKGTRFRPSELKAHRDRWFASISGTQPAIFDTERRAVDRVIFERFRELLHEAMIKELLGEHCWGQSIHSSTLDKIWEISRFLDRADNEFLDPTCEGYRCSFAEAFHRFVDHNDFMQISPVDGFPDRYRLPKEWTDSPNAEVRADFHRAMTNLNSLSTSAYKAYLEMIREIRRLLIVT